jgi:hypothetical protein
MRRQVTGRMPYRCHNGNWRGSRKNITPRALEPREIHRALTDAELERLEPDNVKGERS